MRPFVLFASALVFIATCGASGPAPALTCIDYATAPAPAAQIAVPIIASFVELSGTTAFVGGAGHEVTIIDVTNPLDPVITGHTQALLGDCLRIAGGLAYVGAYDQLVIADVSDPADIRILSTTTMPHPIAALDVAGGFVYALGDPVEGDHWFQVIDVSDPAHPQPVSALSALDTGGPGAVVAAGTIVYVANGEQGLGVIDVSNPAAPLAVWTAFPGVELTSLAIGSTIGWPRAYVIGNRPAQGNGVLLSLDIADPHAITTVSSLDLPANASDIAARTHDIFVAYVACGDAGLAVVDVATYGTPTLVGTLPTCDWTGAVADAGGFLCTADGLGCFRTLNLQCYYRTEGVPAAGVPGLSNLIVQPNPFNPCTMATFTVGTPQDLALAVFDPRGALIRELAAGWFAEGDHHVTWDGRDGAGRQVAAGTYALRITGANGATARPLCLVK